MVPEPHYITINRAFDHPDKFNVVVMKLDPNDEYGVHKCSQQLDFKTAEALAKSWAAATGYEIRPKPTNTDWTADDLLLLGALSDSMSLAVKETALDGLLKNIENSNFVTLTQSMPGVQALLDRACPLFEEYPIGLQLVAMAIMFGIAAASIEGEPVPFEAEHGILLTFEERLKLFGAEARLTYKESMQERGNENAPKNPRVS